MCVANMRAEAGREPRDKGLQDLVGELSTRSEPSRRPQVCTTRVGSCANRFHQPVLGELALACEEFATTAGPVDSVTFIETATDA